MEEGFTKKKVQTLTLGERLVKAREQKRLTKEELAKKTGIRLEYIIAIENRDYAHLPPHVYVKGFLQHISQVLEVPEKALIKMYERECATEYNCKKRNTSKKNLLHILEGKRVIPAFTLTSKTIGLLVAIILLFIGGIYMFRELQHFASAPLLLIASPESESRTEELLTEIRGTIDKKGQVFINEKEIQVNAEGEFAQKLHLAPGVNIFTITAKNQFEKEAQRQIVIHADVEIPEKKEKLHITLLSDTLQKLEIQREKTESREILEISEETPVQIEFEEFIRIFPGNESAFRVIVDEREFLVFPADVSESEDEDVEGIRITKETVKAFVEEINITDNQS